MQYCRPGPQTQRQLGYTELGFERMPEIEHDRHSCKSDRHTSRDPADGRQRGRDITGQYPPARQDEDEVQGSAHNAQSKVQCCRGATLHTTPRLL